MSSEHGSPEPGRKLVIVTGSGRSGTSTAAGTLKYLGLSIPQPEVAADSSNPRGFFEPRWVVDFHKRLLLDAGVATLDARPTAQEKIAQVGSRAEVREELRTWLETSVTDPQVVVKDPRTFWLKDLWRETAEAVGVDANYLTMLRHPAEVVGSRDTHYGKNRSAEDRRARATGVLAGWVNVVLLNEATSRGEPRVFVHYEDLLADWRSAMHLVSTELGLDVNTDLTGKVPHPIDDFIDVDLRRVRITWDDLDVPETLRELADNVWQSLSELADPAGDPEAPSARLDRYREEYDALFEHARALVYDATVARVREVRRQARRQVERELAEAHAPRASLARRVVRKARQEWRTRRAK